MTKSRAEQMAEVSILTALEGVPESEWRNGCENGYKSGFLAGMKAMHLELEKYAQEIKDAEFPATREQQIIVDKIVRDLRKLMGEE